MQRINCAQETTTAEGDPIAASGAGFSTLVGNDRGDA